MNQYLSKTVTLCGFIICLLVSSIGVSYAADPLKVQLRWTHQFQFAGYYMALAKGYYAEQDLQVELIEGGPHALKPIDDVIARRVDFAITGSGSVIDRMEGKPIVAIAAIMQTSPIVWVTLQSSQINVIQDLAGKKVMILPDPESAELLITLKREGIDLDQVILKPTSFNIEDLINGQADAFNGYISNEPYFLKQLGYEYNLINPRDYGINFYNDVLITSESLLKEQPETVRKFKYATLKGWNYALTNIDETVAFIQKHYAPKKTIDHLTFEAETLKSLIMPELVQLGHMNPGRWQFIAESYQLLGMTDAKVNIDGFLYSENESPDYGTTLKVIIVSALLLLLAAGITLKFRKLSQDLEKTNKVLAELAQNDQLTQIKNRRGLLDEANLQLSQAHRNNTESCFIMFDIDNFKQINDHYGHPAGDAALVKFAEIISNHRRQHDIVARVGGEEFSMLLIGADIDQAHSIAKEILKTTCETTMEAPNSGKEFHITVSIGIAKADGCLEEFWSKADRALYQSKENGKNQITIAE